MTLFLVNVISAVTYLFYLFIGGGMILGKLFGGMITFMIRKEQMLPLLLSNLIHLN